MKWVRVDKSEVDDWNLKLKSTNASFFQYPYYASGYKYFLFTDAAYIKLISDANEEIGFCCIMKIQFLFFKIGLVIRGPVFFNNYTDIKSAMSLLKNYSRQNNFIFFRINPNEQTVGQVLALDKEFKPKDYFPSYRGSQLSDFLVYKKPEDQLLKSFRGDCRNKIRFQKELNYQYRKVSDEKELGRIYILFQQLGAKKKFSYRPFASYKRIFFEGAKHDLCSVYIAELNNEIICAAFIVKDGICSTYFSGSLMLNDIKPKFSPANNLHYLIMQDCFYKDNHEIYNLSYSSPGSGTHMFKKSFRPIEENHMGFYTYVIKPGMANLIFRLQKGSLKKTRNKFRKLITMFHK
jgi:hypothetical protein